MSDVTSCTDSIFALKHKMCIPFIFVLLKCNKAVAWNAKWNHEDTPQAKFYECVKVKQSWIETMEKLIK